MKKIPFDIKRRQEIESGQLKVVTEEGAEVDIIKWDAPSTRYPIVGIWPNGRAVNYAPDGERMDADDYIYILSDEPDFTEFEEAVYDLISRDEETVKKEAAHLLKIAYKQFVAPSSEVDVLAALKELNLRILEISERKHGKDKTYWEQSWRLTNTAINSIVDKEVLNC